MFTVLGSTGFIGSHLLAHLQKLGYPTYAPTRGDDNLYKRDLGNVIYAVGLTADFREKPFETVEAHITVLQDVLRRATFRSLLYLSSTRLYKYSGVGEEDMRLSITPSDPDDLYNLSKMMGEALCLGTGNKAVKVVRLSNVYGPNIASSNFLSEVLREGVLTGHVTLHSSLDSEKDYVSIDDVVSLIPQIIIKGQSRVYNIASGSNISHGTLLGALSELIPITIHVVDGAAKSLFPRISIGKVREEFGFQPRQIVDELPRLVAQYRSALTQTA